MASRITFKPAILDLPPPRIKGGTRSNGGGIAAIPFSSGEVAVSRLTAYRHGPR